MNMTWDDIIEQKTNVYRGDIYRIDIELRCNFNKVLLHHMEKHDVTQIEIAKALNVSPITVYNWFNESTYPYIENIQKLKAFFDNLENESKE